ncbi:ABC transporter, permease protein [Lactobacillus gasseri SV-16A-US]|uniref:Ribose/xylose/arabinose/galactoside ABC-type transport system, permease component n=5 Tax=Lactobacillus TaxID=1578 RepID=A0A805ZVZ3_LACGA|nr:Ribose/xylose/arabinose/galactoside ABC-type transport system, permease component [Lactobacillus gasseri ATCC 33323 = JCM 1131]KFL95023.1 ABC transporter, permease protein [Lactobacillus gasseri SJ-9E-US]KFL96802.1 ABC transporter, permease protein [Lactobacillus gasseri SV-16A-US]
MSKKWGCVQMNLIVSAIGQGLLWALLGLGLYLTFRILNFADMTVEGTFPLGAAVAVANLAHGMSPYLATFLALLAGMLAGLVTGLLYTKGKIPILLAGILTMTAIYSINLRIMGGSNISLIGKKTLLNNEFLRSLPQYFNSVVLGIIVVVIITGILVFFLNTDFGQAFIATGDNPKMAKSLGIYTDSMIIIGLMLSNGIVALCGALIAQNNGYADINMGIGTIVIALASIIIGEVAFGELTLNQRLVAVTLGSIIYRLILLAVLQLGFSANDLNLISSIVLALCMMLPQLEKIVHLKKPIEKGVKKHD